MRGIRLVDEVLASLVKEYPDDESIHAELREQLRNCEETATDLFRYASRLLPDVSIPEDRAINPYVVSLDPERWEADGVFQDPVSTR